MPLFEFETALPVIENSPGGSLGRLEPLEWPQTANWQHYFALEQLTEALN